MPDALSAGRETGATVVFGSPVFLVFAAAWIALGIIVLVDAGKYPDWAFRYAGTNKTTWQVVPLVLAFFCGIATLVMAIIWFTSKKPAVQAFAAGAPPQYGQYGAPPPGYGYQVPPPGYGYQQQPPPPGYGPPPGPQPPAWGAPPQPPAWGAPPPPAPPSDAPPSWGPPPTDAPPRPPDPPAQ
jgi:hypothetical protein